MQIGKLYNLAIFALLWDTDNLSEIGVIEIISGDLTTVLGMSIGLYSFTSFHNHVDETLCM